ncbi:chromatin modification- protein VID21, partial [Coelomomyces lativittatus]
LLSDTPEKIQFFRRHPVSLTLEHTIIPFPTAPLTVYHMSEQLGDIDDNEALMKFHVKSEIDREFEHKHEPEPPAIETACDLESTLNIQPKSPLLNHHSPDAGLSSAHLLKSHGANTPESPALNYPLLPSLRSSPKSVSISSSSSSSPFSAPLTSQSSSTSPSSSPTTLLLSPSHSPTNFSTTLATALPTIPTIPTSPPSSSLVSTPVPQLSPHSFKNSIPTTPPTATHVPPSGEAVPLIELSVNGFEETNMTSAIKEKDDFLGTIATTPIPALSEVVNPILPMVYQNEPCDGQEIKENENPKPFPFLFQQKHWPTFYTGDTSSFDHLCNLLKSECKMSVLPLLKVFQHATKTITTRDWLIGLDENRFLLSLNRISQLKTCGKWGLRQLKKQPLPPRLKCHRDYLLDEMNWMQFDFQEEHRYRLFICKEMGSWVLEYFRRKQASVYSKQDEFNDHGMSCPDSAVVPPETMGASTSSFSKFLTLDLNDLNQFTLSETTMPSFPLFPLPSDPLRLKEYLQSEEYVDPIDSLKILPISEHMFRNSVNSSSSIYPSSFSPFHTSIGNHYPLSTFPSSHPIPSACSPSTTHSSHSSLPFLFPISRSTPRPPLHTITKSFLFAPLPPPNVLKSNWDPEEDELLLVLANEYQFNFSLLADFLNSFCNRSFPKHTPMACYERFLTLSQLHPSPSSFQIKKSTGGGLSSLSVQNLSSNQTESDSHLHSSFPSLVSNGTSTSSTPISASTSASSEQLFYPSLKSSMKRSYSLSNLSHSQLGFGKHSSTTRAFREIGKKRKLRHLHFLDNIRRAVQRRDQRSVFPPSKSFSSSAVPLQSHPSQHQPPFIPRSQQEPFPASSSPSSSSSSSNLNTSSSTSSTTSSYASASRPPPSYLTSMPSSFYSLSSIDLNKNPLDISKMKWDLEEKQREDAQLRERHAYHQAYGNLATHPLLRSIPISNPAYPKMIPVPHVPTYSHPFPVHHPSLNHLPNASSTPRNPLMSTNVQNPQNPPLTSETMVSRVPANISTEPPRLPSLHTVPLTSSSTSTSTSASSLISNSSLTPLVPSAPTTKYSPFPPSLHSSTLPASISSPPSHKGKAYSKGMKANTSTSIPLPPMPSQAASVMASKLAIGQSAANVQTTTNVPSNAVTPPLPASSVNLSPSSISLSSRTTMGQTPTNSNA